MPRDVTSEMTLKSSRAAFHELFAVWVESDPEKAQNEGLIGHHLSEAYGYRAQLRQRDSHTLGLACAAPDTSSRTVNARSESVTGPALRS